MIFTKQAQHRKKAPVFGWVLSYVKPYRGWVITCIIASLLVAVADIWMGILIKTMVEHTNNFDKLVSIALIIFCLTIVGFLSKYFITYSAARFSSRAMRDLKNSMASHLEKVPMSTMDKYHSGDLVSRLTTDAQILQRFLQQHFFQLFYLPVVFLGALGLLLTINWKLIIFSVAILPVAIAITGWMSRPLQKYSEQMQDHLGQTNAIAQDTLSGIHMVKAFQLEGVLYRKYHAGMKQVLKNAIQAEKKRAWMTAPGILLFSSPILFFVAYGGYLIQAGELDLGSLVIFSYLLHFIIEPLSLAPVLFAQVQETSGAAKRLQEIFSQPVEQNDQPVISVDPEAIPVQFENVTFAYDQARILHNVSFTLYPNKTIALVGASGSGKSTIIKLLCGFYQMEPGNGRLNVFGHSMTDWNMTDMRSYLSMVSQDTTLFPVSIAENISYGRIHATQDEIIAAAKAANAHNFIMELPQGYQTKVGERGSRLSGGQKQRIAIARAILKDAPILLLDEPTSALDTESEALVQEALENVMKNRTVLVIAHRLSTIKEADEVLVLEQGQIVERGTHYDLLGQGGVYTRLYQKQFATERQSSLAAGGV
ncbi:ABC transporter ATP-binding protein [Brevibacillus sp. MS2.2]|uniref:ABC transporter ATP-binding protein n=1 Tax=Brevibacillus sp. MS2.2 TaxID=2738981 RepID=UPI00156B2CD8|nr:ABC transporter ATP-binding protein [Brevibacillus sp. MS2.2]NRR23356.1 ABC transporter ATP-binding protein [Brevibacillus sp. MS2.2]